MLVRFLKSGPVKFGPASIHGLQGQLADMDGDDLAAAVASGVVELVEALAKPTAKTEKRKAN